MSLVPDSLVRVMQDLHGDAGRQWAESVPAILRELSSRWGVEVGAPFPELSYNFVCEAVLPDGQPAVIKLGHPRDEAFWHEAEALRAFDGRGVVRLLAEARDLTAMLIERARPGARLLSLGDDEAMTEVAARLLRDLHVPPPDAHRFPTLADWGQGMRRLREHYGGASGPFPPRLLEAAEACWRELLASQVRPMLLHGDCHHYNILSTEGGWVIIDPKGVVGDPAYEVVPFMLNPADVARSPRRVFERRLDIICDLTDLDRQRIVRWTVAHSVLSAWWGVEDHGEPWVNALAVGEIFCSML